MPDYGQCGDPSCTEISVRLFDCAHHCMKMVCLQHLIEHDRLIERNKRQLEINQIELKRLYAIYSSLIDETKLRFEYEQKLIEYQRLVRDINSLFENNSNDIEQFRIIIDKLKKLINEKQKTSCESLTIVKVEPIEEVSSNIQKDDSLYIGFDRLQNLVIDTDYHKRKTIENNTTGNEPETEMITVDDDGDYSINTEMHIRNIVGQCPLSINGSYGLNQEHHSLRLCQKKRLNDLYNHLRQYHGLLAPIANVLTRAIYSKIPVTKRLFPNNLQVIDPRRSFLCPLNVDCQNRCWLPVSALKTHLIDVHKTNPSMAEVKAKQMKILNKNKSILNIKNKAFQVIRKIESANKGQGNHIHLKRQTNQ